MIGLDYKVEGVRPRDRPKKSWRLVERLWKKLS